VQRFGKSGVGKGVVLCTDWKEKMQNLDKRERIELGTEANIEWGGGIHPQNVKCFEKVQDKTNLKDEIFGENVRTNVDKDRRSVQTAKGHDRHNESIRPAFEILSNLKNGLDRAKIDKLFLKEGKDIISFKTNKRKLKLNKESFSKLRLVKDSSKQIKRQSSYHSMNEEPALKFNSLKDLKLIKPKIMIKMMPAAFRHPSTKPEVPYFKIETEQKWKDQNSR
jgi:hypothetical protein